MAPLLYLDTARLGQMTPAAKDAQLDVVRLSAEEPSSLYFEQFLRDGFSAWPTFYQERFPGLRTWTGVSGLKESIRRLVKAQDDWQVLLASWLQLSRAIRNQAVLEPTEYCPLSCKSRHNDEPFEG